jgi:hypothetical protein
MMASIFKGPPLPAAERFDTDSIAIKLDVIALAHFAWLSYAIGLPEKRKSLGYNPKLSRKLD